MKRYSSDWEQRLTSPPFTRNQFTEKHKNQVQKQIQLRHLQRNRRKWLYISVPAAVACILALLFLIQPEVFRPLVNQVNTWFAEQEEMPQPQPQLEQQEPLHPDLTVKFKGRTMAFLDPQYWSSNHEELIVTSGQEYSLLEEKDDFVKVQIEGQAGWVPSWYVGGENEAERITALEPYEMIVRAPTYFYAYPDQQAPAGFELEEGSVVQVLQQYDDWFAVHIQLYAEPMLGDKWIHKDALIEYSDKDAKEGYLRLTNGGSYIYADPDRNQQKEHISTMTSVRIEEEFEGMYRITSPGGRSGYIMKEDFVPNPFGMTRGTYLELPPALEETLNQFIESRDDEALRGLEPVDLFIIYQHAQIMADPGLLFDLIVHHPDDERPSREQYIREYEEHALLNERNTLNFIYRVLGTEFKAVVEGDEAYVQPLHQEDDDWIFRLVKNQDGIWKVSWYAMQ